MNQKIVEIPLILLIELSLLINILQLTFFRFWIAPNILIAIQKRQRILLQEIFSSYMLICSQITSTKHSQFENKEAESSNLRFIPLFISFKYNTNDANQKYITGNMAFMKMFTSLLFRKVRPIIIGQSQLYFLFLIIFKSILIKLADILLTVLALFFKNQLKRTIALIIFSCIVSITKLVQQIDKNMQGTLGKYKIEQKIDDNLSQSMLSQLNHKTQSSQSVCAPADDHQNRPSIRGPYRPIRTGTVTQSIFALLASVLGTGNLNLPLRIDQLSLIPFVIIILLTSLLSYLGMNLMSKFMVRFKVVSYSQMVRRSFGIRIMKIAESVLIFYPWAVVISHQVILSKFIMQIFHDQLGFNCYQDREKDIYNFYGHVGRTIVAILVVFFNRHNFFNKDLRDMLRSLGKFSVTGVIFNMIVIVITAFLGFSKNYKGEVIEYKGIINMNYDNVDFFKEWSPHYLSIVLQGISGIFYTFLNPQFIFPLVSHLRRPTIKRVNRIFWYAHIYEVIIYLFISVSGYLLLSQHKTIIPISPLIITSISIYPLILGKIALICSTFLTLPLHIFTARQYLYQALDLQRNDQNQNKITYSLVISSLLLSIFFQQVTAYYGLIGGISGIIIACLIPTACNIKKIKLKAHGKKVIVFVVILSILAFAGGILSVVDAP